MFFRNSEKFDEYLQREGAVFLKQGSDATGYKVGKRVIRRLIYPERYSLEKVDKYLQFKDLAIKNFLFSEEIISYPLKIAGTFMPFGPGERLCDFSLDTENIILLIAALEALIPAIEALSEEKVNVSLDVAARNTLFDGKDFYFIDTSEYIKNNISASASLEFNTKKIMYMLYQQLFRDYGIYRFVQSLYHFSVMYGSDFLFLSPREVLINIKNKLEE